MSEVHVGIVGYGLAGRVFHGMLIRHTPGLRVHSIVTGNPERRAQAARDFPDAKIYSTYEEMLQDDEVELVVIGTPHNTHKDLTLAACAHRKHVVVDKIMALSVEEADAMIEAAQQAGVLLSVFHNRRWDSDYLTVRAALEQGLIGEPYVIESCVVTPPRRSSFTPNAELRWRSQARFGGGPYRDWGAHLMDQAVQLFGAGVETVYADFQYRVPEADVETAAVCEMRFPSGVRYRVEVGHISYIGRPRWYVRGSAGALVIEGLDPQENALKQGEVIGGTPRAAMPAGSVRFVDARGERPIPIIPGDYTQYYKNIAAALRGDMPLAVTPESVRDVLRVMEAAILSAKTRETVHLT